VELLKAAAAAAAAPPPAADLPDGVPDKPLAANLEGMEAGPGSSSRQQQKQQQSKGVRPPSRSTSPPVSLSLSAEGPGGLPHTAAAGESGGEGDTPAAAAGGGSRGGNNTTGGSGTNPIAISSSSSSSRRAGLQRSRSRSDLSRPGRGTPVLSDGLGQLASDEEVQEQQTQTQTQTQQSGGRGGATMATGSSTSSSSSSTSSCAVPGTSGGGPGGGGGQQVTQSAAARVAGALATPPTSPALPPGRLERPGLPFQSPRGEGHRSGKEAGLGLSASEGGMAGGSAMRGIKLPFPPRHLYTCTVGRARSKARYSLASANEVVGLMQAMVSQGRCGLSPAGSGGGGVASYPPRWSSGGDSTPHAAGTAGMSRASSWSGGTGPGPAAAAAPSRQHSRGSGLTLNVQQLGRRGSSGALVGPGGEGDEEDLSWHAAPSPVSLRGLAALTSARRMSSITPSEDLPSPDSIYGCR
jgi:hypothetical protein